MKKITQRLLIVALSVLSVVAAQAQDIHFSQFYMSPLNLNPALTGVMNCNHRLVANYRNQWASILKQFATLQARLSGSYAKKMGGYRRKAHYLVVGADAGVSQRSINSAALQWPSQNDNGQFNGNLPGEIVNDPNFLFMDLSAGLLWFSVFDQHNNFYFGGAFSHLNRANVSFDRETQNIPLYSKFTFHAGGEFEVAQRVGMLPGVVTFFQGPSFQVNVGNSFKFLLGNSRRYNQAFQLGAWARVSNRLDSGKLMDAFILSTRFDYETFNIGFSYDVNTSNLNRATNGNGAFEFSLVYKICGPEKRGVYCPNF